MSSCKCGIIILKRVRENDEPPFLDKVAILTSRSSRLGRYFY